MIQPATKDLDAARPIASAWRSTLREVVKAFARGDFALAKGIPGVAPIAPADAQRMQRYVEDYGCTLTELSEETWKSSVAQWMSSHWEVLLDLWTLEEGRSDLVLFVRVHEHGEDFRFTIDSLHVP